MARRSGALPPDAVSYTHLYAGYLLDVCDHVLTQRVYLHILGVDYGVVKKAGSWFSYGDRKIGQGRDAVKMCIRDRNEAAEKIKKRKNNRQRQWQKKYR